MALTGALVACTEPAPLGSTTRAEPLRAVTVDSVGIGARLSIRVAAPTMVRVRYAPRAEAAETLELTASLIAGGGPIILTRLAHGLAYDFSVQALDPAGVPGPATSGTFVTPPLPADLASLHVTVSGVASNALTMCSPRTDGGFNGVVAVDATGTIVWYYRTLGPAQGVLRRANGNFVVNDGGTVSARSPPTAT
jgi:hypothetical protein